MIGLEVKILSVFSFILSSQSRTTNKYNNYDEWCVDVFISESRNKKNGQRFFVDINFLLGTW